MRKQARSRPEEAYYYADGKRVVLRRASDLLALDTRVVEQRGSKAARDALQSAKPLRSGVSVANAAAVPPEVVAELQALKALQPVLAFDSGFVVVLPEVRVEEGRPEKLHALARWIGSARDRVRAEGALESGRIVLHPISGTGQDALDLANELHEKLSPELAQARFVRVVQRPDA